MRRAWILILVGLAVIAPARDAVPSDEAILRWDDLGPAPTTCRAEPGPAGTFTWWLPESADEYVLPISAGVVVTADEVSSRSWLRDRSPWSLMGLPALGVRHESRLMVVIVPWPHYATLIVQDRIGIRYAFPEGRRGVTPSPHPIRSTKRMSWRSAGFGSGSWAMVAPW